MTLRNPTSTPLLSVNALKEVFPWPVVPGVAGLDLSRPWQPNLLLWSKDLFSELLGGFLYNKLPAQYLSAAFIVEAFPSR